MEVSYDPERMDTRPPSLEDAYKQHYGLFLDVLGHLAQEGYVLPLAEAPDVIHDFLVDSYEGLRERYEGTHGAGFTTYLCKAFHWFARRRIYALRRLASPTKDLEAIAALAPSAGEVPASVSGADRARFGAALEAIDGEDRVRSEL